jgi:hypothetical protein
MWYVFEPQDILEELEPENPRTAHIARKGLDAVGDEVNGESIKLADVVSVAEKAGSTFSETSSEPPEQQFNQKVEKYIDSVAAESYMMCRESIEGLARDLRSEIDAGKSVEVDAAAAVYTSAMLHFQQVTQYDLAEAADVTQQAISTRYRSIAENISEQSDW